jgi:hypothetical protein
LLVNHRRQENTEKRTRGLTPERDKKSTEQQLQPRKHHTKKDKMCTQRVHKFECEHRFYPARNKCSKRRAEEKRATRSCCLFTSARTVCSTKEQIVKEHNLCGKCAAQRQSRNQPPPPRAAAGGSHRGHTGAFPDHMFVNPRPAPKPPVPAHLRGGGPVIRGSQIRPSGNLVQKRENVMWSKSNNFDFLKPAESAPPIPARNPARLGAPKGPHAGVRNAAHDSWRDGRVGNVEQPQIPMYRPPAASRKEMWGTVSTVAQNYDNEADGLDDFLDHYS